MREVLGCHTAEFSMRMAGRRRNVLICMFSEWEGACICDRTGVKKVSLSRN